MNITLIIGIIILALIAQKNPPIAFMIIVIYFIYKIPKKKQDATQNLIKSQEKNTFNLIIALEEGQRQT